MSLAYSLIVPHYRTPAITRLTLHALHRFCTGTPEILLIHHDPEPGPEDLALFAEFPTLRLLPFEPALQGAYRHFEALDVGLAAARHDRVVILHSDTICLKMGWDEELFGRMEQEGLDALGTLAREANPFRPWRKRVGDLWQSFRHRRHPTGKDAGGRLMLHFLLTRKSVLSRMGYNFSRQGHITVGHYLQAGYRMELLSLREVSRYIWHISNTTSLFAGLMEDPHMWRKFHQKWRIFLQDPFIASQFAALGDPLANLPVGGAAEGGSLSSKVGERHS
ncbi:MAG: glycosyltransferase [Magnetococcus sp. MYC-9]